MGANAQTSVPSFTAGEVLSAANMNLSARTGVPVFSNTGNRDAAFGGTGEKTLAEGQMCYVEGTGFQTYNGSSWVTWGTAPSSGLTYITGGSFSAVTSFSAANDTFTTTYDNYRIIVDISAITSTATFTMRLRTSGTDNSNSNYYTMGVGIDNNGVTRNFVSSAATSFTVGGALHTPADYYIYSLTFDVIAPKLSRPTEIAGVCNWSAATYFASTPFGGAFQPTTAFDAFSFISSAASSISGNYRVYGYQNS